MRKLIVKELVGSTVPTATTSYTFDAHWCHVESIQMVWASTTASFSYQVQGSNDGTNWVDAGSSQAISNNSGTIALKIKDNHLYAHYKCVLTKTSGALTDFKIHVAHIMR